MRLMTVLFTVLPLTACATPRDSRIDPAGPYLDLGTGNLVREDTDNGVLVVTTSKVRVDQEGRLYNLPNDLDWDSSHSVPSGYAIYDLSGRLFREVPNHSSLIVSDEGPTAIALPTGRYLVRLDRAEDGVRTFWVTIEARRRSEVDPMRLVPSRSGQVDGLDFHNPAAAPSRAPSGLPPSPVLGFRYSSLSVLGPRKAKV